MRYCPNVACAHRKSCRYPAEFVDKVTTCSDCGTHLVDDRRVAVDGVTPEPTYEPRGYREPAVRPTEDDADARARAARLDVATGIGLIALGVLLPLTTSATAFADGGGPWLVSIWPFVFGAHRLSRGMNARAAET
jgi:hypothetical protein